jgi:hypothetical protein
MLPHGSTVAAPFETGTRRRSFGALAGFVFAVSLATLFWVGLLALVLQVIGWPLSWTSATNLALGCATVMGLLMAPLFAGRDSTSTDLG